MSKSKKLRYDQFDIRTFEQHEANSVIMELACDLAEGMMLKKMRVKSVDSKKVTINQDGECTYTEKAQDIFNDYYDQMMDECYAAANRVNGKVTAKSLRKAMMKKK